MVNLRGGGGFREAEQANDRDSCDCLDLSPSALVHSQLCGLTSNRLQLQMFPICLVCLCVYVCKRILAMDVWIWSYVDKSCTCEWVFIKLVSHF